LNASIKVVLQVAQFHDPFQSVLTRQEFIFIDAKYVKALRRLRNSQLCANENVIQLSKCSRISRNGKNSMMNGSFFWILGLSQLLGVSAYVQDR
jgi:hypothetical protein